MQRKVDSRQILTPDTVFVTNFFWTNAINALLTLA